MNIQQYTTQQLVERWEAMRAVRNLMGRMTQEILYKGESAFFDRFWSGAEDICLGINTGWYLGPEAVRAYYASIAEETELADRTLRRRFPTLTDERYGIGQFDVKPLSSDLVEVAGDLRTAKGIWTYQGSDVRMTVKGPLSYWTAGVYAADFIREDGQWRIWHLLEMRDIDCPCGERWWKPMKERPDEPGFEDMKEAGRPTPTVQADVYALWAPGRKRRPAPACPVPYETFKDTFSYGYEEG